MRIPIAIGRSFLLVSLVSLALASEACSPCGDLSQSFEAFAERNNHCEADEDCTLIGGSVSCNCGPSLGPCAGSPVNRAVDMEQVRAFERVFESCRSSLDAVCDCGLGRGLVCRDHQCVITEHSACSFFDAGMPGDGADGGSKPDDERQDEPEGDLDGGLHD